MEITLNITEEIFKNLLDSNLCPQEIGLDRFGECHNIGCEECWRGSLKYKAKEKKYANKIKCGTAKIKSRGLIHYYMLKWTEDYGFNGGFVDVESKTKVYYKKSEALEKYTELSNKSNVSDLRIQEGII